MENFANTIRSKRKNLGLTQQQLASTMQIDATYLSKLENARNSYPPSEEMLRKLSSCLNLDYNELLINSGRIKSNSYSLFTTLAEKYPRFIPFMQKLNQDRDFATSVFQALEESTYY